MKKLRIIVITITTLIFIFTQVPMEYVSALDIQQVITEPQNKQVIPYYDVWLRWNDVSGESYYLLSVRNITTGNLLYYNQYISPNSTYFVIPTSNLVKGNRYRWSLCMVDSQGNKTFFPEHHFQIEYGLSSGEDSHLWRTGYASASHIDYFIHAPTSGYASQIESYVNSWNGISSNVYLHRDYSDTTKELGIYENYNPINAKIWGNTYPGGSGNSNIEPYNNQIVTYTEVILYMPNLDISQYNDFELRYTTLHEVGHALSLAHTNGVDDGETANAPSDNCIGKTYDLLDTLSYEERKNPLKDNVYLVMNQSGAAVRGNISTTDRDHLRIKWGA